MPSVVACSFPLLLLLLLLLLLGVYAFRYAWAIRRNVLLARATGLPYVVLP